jgi:PAS domain S-box-containing protein
VSAETALLNRPAFVLSDAVFRAILENSFDTVVILDRFGTVQYESPGVLRTLGYDPREREQRTAAELVHPDDIPRMTAIFNDLVSGHAQQVRSVVRARHKDGTWRIMQSTTTNLLDDPNVRGIVIVSRDITEQRAAAEENARLLEREREARATAEHTLEQLMSLQSVADALSGALTIEHVTDVIVDQGVRVLGAVVGALALLDASGTAIELVAYRGSRRQFERWQRFPIDTPIPAAEAIRTGEQVFVESRAAFRARYPSVGQTRPRGQRATAAQPVVANGRVAGALILTFKDDLTFAESERLFMRLLARQCGQALERARLYQELAEREQRLGDLVRRLLASQEEERRRLAYELHDGLAQVATATHQHLQVLASHYPPASAEQRDELQRGLLLAQRTVREARNLIRGLRPTVLDDFGLARAVLVETEALESDGWRVTLDERLGDARLPAPIETALYRVLQEALSNIRKHAGQTRVQVSLRRRGQTVRLMVRDWGNGFSAPSEAVLDSSQGGHIGAEGMRERIDLLDGQFSIRSRPGRGTTIEASVPVPELVSVASTGLVR